MKHLYKLALIFTIWLSVSLAQAQPQRFPANVTPTLGLPYSLFLSDYTDPAKEQLVANILFNDFNESQWTFKLKIRLEGFDILMETKADFRPSQPITVSPGELVRFTGADWAEYFDYRNLNITGNGRNVLFNSGRLPEGGYNLYVQVLDYDTGDPLSRETPISWWMGLMNPPLLIAPQEDAYINPASVQIPFLWQLFNVSPVNNVMGVEYELTLWEITDNTIPFNQINPLSAVQNGQALEIYQSGIVSTSSLNYGLAEPSLEAGKAYIYRVQALDPEGRDMFKNQGYSQYRRFYYGWPLNGKIALKNPVEGHSLGLDENASVHWKAPDNMIGGQQVKYEVRIAEVAAGESAAMALAGDLWFQNETPPNTSTLDQGMAIDVPTATYKYAWEVIAYSGEQEVARSMQQLFFGPPLMQRFFAGLHMIEVNSLNNDRDNLTGSGRVQLDPGVWTDVTFQNLKVRRSGMLWVLYEGEILIDTDLQLALTPTAEVNGEATFTASKYRLNKDGLSIKGRVDWPLHLASYSESQATVKSQDNWFGFNEYTLVGNMPMAEGNEFDLLDPFGFRLNIDPSSQVIINENRYTLYLTGTVGLPTKVKSAGSQERVEIPFQSKGQIYYFSSDQVSVLSPLLLAEGANILLESDDFTLDFSEEQSPGQFANEPDWKGIVYNQAKLTLPINFDPKGGLRLKEDKVIDLTPAPDGSPVAYIGNSGLYFKKTLSLTGDVLYFNTFPATADELVLEVIASQLTEESSFAGKALIPVLSTKVPFDFTVPVTGEGFMAGYFQGLEEYQFTHNADVEEQRMIVTVKRAVIEEKERLSMTLDISWPALDISMQGLRYFKAWGNYNIGFYTPEGIYALDNQLASIYKGYPVTIDAIGAGRSNGQYGFGVSGKLNLGDDVAGEEGAPSFNMYSLATNELLPGDYVAKPLETGQGKVSTFDFDAEKNSAEEAIKQEEENLYEKLQQKTQSLEGEIDNELAAWSGQNQDTTMMAENLLDIPAQENQGIDWSDTTGLAALIPDLLLVMTQAYPEDTYVNIFGQKMLNKSAAEKSQIFPTLIALPKKISVDFAQHLSGIALGPIEGQILKVNGKITETVKTMLTEVNQEVASLVGNIVDNASSDLIASLADQSPQAAQAVGAIAQEIKRALIVEVQTSISNSVYDNLTLPINVLLQDQLLGRADAYLKRTAEEAVMASFTPGKSITQVLDGALGGIDDELKAMGDDVLTFLRPESMKDRLRALGADAVSGISGERIMGRLQAGATNAIAEYAANKVVGAVSELANRAISEDIGVEIPLNVGGAITKVLKGGSVKEVLSDPIVVKVRSKAIDFNGMIQMTEDHPIYGDVFSGGIDVRIKVPDPNKPIDIQAVYMNGRKDGVAYWFVEVGGEAKSIPVKTTANSDSYETPKGMDNVGGEMSEQKTEPANGINLGIMEIMALRGRVYKRMRADGLNGMVPDASNEFGAYLHMIMYGPSKGEKVRMEIEGQVNTSTDGNLILDLSGNVQVASNNPQIHQPDPTASVQGTIDIYYNRNEKHFMGYATVVLISEGICGEGSLLVDVKPGYWRVALGNREDRIGVVPGCVGMAYYGWVDLRSDYVEVGAGIGLAFQKDFSINLKVVKVGLGISAGLNLNAFASVNYKPLTVREIGIFVEMWASVYASYKLPLKSTKTLQLADIYFYASSTMRFYPAPTLLYGTLNGKVRLLSIISFSFNKDYEIEL